MNNDKSRLCNFCGGALQEKTLPYFDYPWGNESYRFENVPALVCQQCGEKYFHATVSQAMNKAVASQPTPKRFAQVPVLDLVIGPFVTGAKTPA